MSVKNNFLEPRFWITYGLPTIHNLSGQTASEYWFLLKIRMVERD
jgi:hypothetical protein